MNAQSLSKAKIFPAGERGCSETDWYRSYQTFNSVTYRNKFKQPFHGLKVLNEVTLAGGHNIKTDVEESSVVLLLPVVGSVAYSDSANNQSRVNAGQLQLCYLNGGDSFELSNTYEKELINFLQLHVKAGKQQTACKQLFNFDLDKNKNKLITVTNVFAQSPFVSIGKFAGREEAVYKLKNERNSLFVFIIEGVFEVQGRLLESKDGLGLWNVSEDIELEALSNDAILLMIELWDNN